jgi:hypothetical protein
MLPAKKPTEAERTEYQRIVTETIPPLNWKEITEHHHEERMDRILERAHPNSDFVLPNDPGQHRNATHAFLHALEQLVRHDHKQDPDDVFSYNFTSVKHPELIEAGFTDQAEILLQLKHANIFKEIRSEHIEGVLAASLLDIQERLGNSGINSLRRLAPNTDPERMHLGTTIEEARNTLRLYNNDTPIPFAEVVDRLNELVGPSPVSLGAQATKLTGKMREDMPSTDRNAAYDAIGTAQQLGHAVEETLGLVRQLQELGVGRWHKQGHISH